MYPKQNLLRERRQLEAERMLSANEVGHYRLWCDITSPYSCKLRTYLNYKEIPYKRMRITMQDYMVNIPAKVGMSIMPVLINPADEILQDTTPIMLYLEGQHGHRRCIPDDPRLAFLDRLVEDFGDEYLPRFSMHYRWGNELNRQTLSHRIARNFSYGLPDVHPGLVAPQVLLRQSGFDKPLGLSGTEARASLDRQLLDLLAILDGHFERFQFLLGDRPSLADFAVYGHLYAHLFNDPFSAQILECHGARVCNWLDTISEFGDVRGGIGQTTFGDWLDLDTGVPDSLRQLLAFIARTWVPFSCGAARGMQQGLKYFDAVVYDTPVTAAVFNYRVWSLEQVQREYVALPGEGRAFIDALLSETGILPRFMADGIIHSTLFDGFTPPFVRDGVADARIRHIKSSRIA